MHATELGGEQRFVHGAGDIGRGVTQTKQGGTDTDRGLCRHRFGHLFARMLTQCVRNFMAHDDGNFII